MVLCFIDKLHGFVFYWQLAGTLFCCQYGAPIITFALHLSGSYYTCSLENTKTKTISA